MDYKSCHESALSGAWSGKKHGSLLLISQPCLPPTRRDSVAPPPAPEAASQPHTHNLVRRDGRASAPEAASQPQPRTSVRRDGRACSATDTGCNRLCASREQCQRSPKLIGCKTRQKSFCSRTEFLDTPWLESMMEGWVLTRKGRRRGEENHGFCCLDSFLVQMVEKVSFLVWVRGILAFNCWHYYFVPPTPFFFLSSSM